MASSARARSTGVARTLRIAGIAGGLMLSALVVAVPASAAPTCMFDAMTGTVTVEVGNGETATIARSGDAITLDGTPCDVATVTNTDAIVVNGTGIPAAIVIDLSGGPFAPGQATESDGGDSEIEFTIVLPAGSPNVTVLGSADTDVLVAGAGGINLNAAESAGDADVLIIGLPAITLDGAAGPDTLSVAGGSGTGAERAATLDGGAGDDQLRGALGGSTFDGGDGVDTADYAAANGVTADLSAGTVDHPGAQLDQVAAIENVDGSPQQDRLIGDGGANVLRAGDGADVITGGGGDDTLNGQVGLDTADFSASSGGVTVSLRSHSANGDGNDSLQEIEAVIGSPANDSLVGDPGPNVLSGGGGDDTIDGDTGDDALDGGGGKDTVQFDFTDAGVDVDLRDGVATGSGADTLADIEQVTGTDKADTIHGDNGVNRLLGGSGRDSVYGHDGRDEVRGGDGNDLVFGQRGKDQVFGEKGKDQLDGGDGQDSCKGGPDPDSFVFCEKITLG
jgi:Ca2+-binding RTX toxin-like protein